MKKGKKLAQLFCGLLAATMLLSGCGGGGTSSTAPSAGGEAASQASATEGSENSSTAPAGDSDIAGAHLEVQFNGSGELLDHFNGIMDKFMDETGVVVEVTAPGAEQHEASMKTRMASNDLPDLWVTHGWSVLRYGEYLMPLNDQEWISRIDESLLPAITADNGDIYVLPVAEGVASLFYNKDVIEAAGIDVSAIRTWDDFTAALGTVAEKSPDVTPFLMSALNGTSFDSYLLELMFPSMWTNSDLDPNFREELKNGSFDWDANGTPVFEMIDGWNQNGYFNEDKMTADRDTIIKAFANGEGAFCAYSTEIIPPAQVYNPDANIGILPIPARDEDHASSFGVGEGNFSTFAIWKDTEAPEAAKALLNYMAQPEVAADIIENIDGGLPALEGVDVPSITAVTEYDQAKEQFAGDLVSDNFFDRVYLPSGMWNVMQESMAILLGDGDVAGAVEHMKSEYQALSGE